MSTDPIESLHAALDADPSDADARLRLADLLDAAAGYPTLEAEAQRWMATERRWPAYDGTWDWWCFLPNRELDTFADEHEHHSLALGLFESLFGGEVSVSGWAGDCCYREYPTRRAAEDALAAALATASNDPPP